MRERIRSATIVVHLFWMGSVPLLLHAAPPSSISVSSDIDVVLGGSLWSDNQVGVDNLLGVVGPAQLVGLPADVDIVAYQVQSDGRELFGLDRTTELLGGVFLGAGDIGGFDGASFSVVFDARAEGVPDGIRTDAVSTSATGDLLLSFDASVELNGVSVDDEDVVAFDGSVFSLWFDGSSVGVSDALDVDGLSVLDADRVAISFDGSGTIGGVAFDDEDALELEISTGSWSLLYDASDLHPDWPAAELDALSVVPEPGEVLLVVAGIAWLAASQAHRKRSSLLADQFQK